MTYRPLLIVSISLLFSFGQASPTLRPDPPKACDSCAEWNAPVEPFRVFGNTYYVGPAGVSAMLITSPGGHILVDGALTQSAVMIDANIRKLGFRTEDIKLMVNGHAHYDHTGAFAAIQRVSGAPVAASPLGVKAPHLAAWTEARRLNASRYVRLFHELEPDLIFLDIVLPNKDGIQFLKEIKILKAATPAIKIRLPL